MHEQTGQALIRLDDHFDGRVDQIQHRGQEGHITDLRQLGLPVPVIECESGRLRHAVKWVQQLSQCRKKRHTGLLSNSHHPQHITPARHYIGGTTRNYCAHSMDYR